MIGRSLRQYVITGQLGQGGMGQVWKARDTILEREVALKILPPQHVDDPERKDRLFREAKSASALNHPNIVTIYEINSDQGIDFIAMEYVVGETLAKLIHRGALTVDAVIRLAIQAADGVGRAHRAGIVHRDLKPGNIMVTTEGLVKVLDFGLAKAWAPARVAVDDVTRMASTQVGTTVGTIGYMSPEQAIGDAVDARSDVFSFGVVLYQMLSGSLPFAADTQVEMLRKLHFEDPPPLAAVRPEAPAAVTNIIARALAKTPADRYATCSDVATALRDAQGGTAVRETIVATAVHEAIPTRLSPSQSLRGRFSFRSTRRAVATVVVVLLLAGAGAALWRFSGLVGTSHDSALADVAADPPELSRQAAALLARYDKEGNVDRAIANLERALGADPQYATAQAYLSEAYMRRHQANPDQHWLNLAREAARRAVELGPDLAAAHLAVARVSLEGGARDDAVTEFKRAADLDPVNPMPHVGLSMVFAAQRQDAQAEQAVRKAIELGGDDFRPYLQLGQFYFSRARYADAVTAWEFVRKVTPDNVNVLRNLAAAYYFLGRHDEAASSLQRALEVRPSAPTYTNLGTIRFFQGRYADAVAAFEKAVELSANNYLYWGNLGDGYRWASGRRTEAAGAYRRASELIKVQIAQKPQDPDLRTREALYLIKMGDTKAALAEIDTVASRPDLSAQMLYRLAVVYELAGDRGRSLTAVEGALKAGYPVSELQSEPELLSLRADTKYHRLIDRVSSREPK
jgi:tetratricopeptide (TPR) repeat protein/tRNA A-37 threonylcarbamoyl transferase component Bud32